MIQDLIQRKFGVFYSAKYMSQLLKTLGSSYQKARFAVGRKNPDNQPNGKNGYSRLGHGQKFLKKQRRKMHTFFLEMKSLFRNGEVLPTHGHRRRSVNFLGFIVKSKVS